MRWLLFLSRLTLLCNCCFAIFVAFRYLGSFIANRNIQSTIIVLGMLAIIVNIIVNIILALMLLSHKKSNIPSWLIATNFSFLIVEILFYF
jgi:hypothetical protein